MSNLPQDPVKKDGAPNQGQDMKNPQAGDKPMDNKPMDKPVNENVKQ